MQKLTIRDFPLKHKKVLMRVDFNVPLDEKGNVTDDTRIREALATIEYIMQQNAALILMSHLGRPQGKRDMNFSLAPCAKRLSELLKRPVLLAPDCVGEEVERLAANLRPGNIILLENLRFHKGEEKPEEDPSFVKKLAQLGDVYVNDAFGAAHRKHASTYAIAAYFKGKSLCGFLMEKEITTLASLLSHPKTPFYALIGGAKVETKIGVLKSLLSKVDALFLGGGMAYAFFYVQGISIGSSIFDEKNAHIAKEFLSLCEKHSVPMHLPEDIVIADRFAEDAKMKIIHAQEGIPEGWQGMDIGPKTLETWRKMVSQAQTIFWNGPMGVFEFSQFASGTENLAKILASLKATTVVGGGDSVAAITKLKLEKKFTHLSTGGGASLEFIEFGHLPGIDILTDKETSASLKK